MCNVFASGTILSYLGVGTIVTHGPGVEFPPIGSRVGIKYAADACLTCGRSSLFYVAGGFCPTSRLLRYWADNCIENGDSSCMNAKISGYFTPGTFQQYCIASARYLTPIPDGLELAAAAPLMCGGISVYTSLKRANLCPGHWVVICGAGGGLGHLGIQYAKAMGGRVLALDTELKREFCFSLGSDEFLDFTAFQCESDIATKIKEVTEGGSRIVLMCASSGKAYSQAMSWLGFRGTLACLGIPDSEGCLVPNIGAMVTDELRIIGKFDICFIPSLTNGPQRRKRATGLMPESAWNLLLKVVSKPTMNYGKWRN